MCHRVRSHRNQRLWQTADLLPGHKRAVVPRPAWPLSHSTSHDENSSGHLALQQLGNCVFQKRVVAVVERHRRVKLSRFEDTAIISRNRRRQSCYHIKLLSELPALIRFHVVIIEHDPARGRCGAQRSERFPSPPDGEIQYAACQFDQTLHANVAAPAVRPSYTLIALSANVASADPVTRCSSLASCRVSTPLSNCARNDGSARGIGARAFQSLYTWSRISAIRPTSLG